MRSKDIYGLNTDNSVNRKAAIDYVWSKNNNSGYMEGTYGYIRDLSVLNDEQIARSLMGIFEGSRKKWNPMSKDGSITPACHKSCAWCCYLNVDMLEAEAYFIADQVNKKFDKEKRERISIQMKKNREKTRNLAPDQKEHTRHRCPFLDDDNSCSIYEIRPLACRGMYTADDKQCEKVCMSEGVSEGNWFWGHPKMVSEDILSAGVLLYLEQGLFGMASMETFMHDLIKTE
jgi:Fe-S-cluster containining protein